MERKVYTPKDSVVAQRDLILKDFVNIIKSTIPTNGYAFKGGYILKSILSSCDKTKNIRHTTDIDVDLSCEEYQELLINRVIPYLEELKRKGVIYSYAINKVEISASGVPISGRIILYRKPSANVKKRVFCGIDFNVHPLFYGIVKMSDGTSIYAIERTLGDKFMALYLASEKKLLHRVKDILDLYLLNQFLTEKDAKLDFSITLRTIQEELVQNYNLSLLPPVSDLEKMLISNPEKLYNEVRYLLKTERVSADLLEYSTVPDIVKVAVSFINVVRCKYYEFYR